MNWESEIQAECQTADVSQEVVGLGCLVGAARGYPWAYSSGACRDEEWRDQALPRAENGSASR
jgi:hypothetical protein